MSKAKRDSIATLIIFKLEDYIERNDKEGFRNYLSGKNNEYPAFTLLHNCIVGDAFMEERTRQTLRKALEKFV